MIPMTMNDNQTAPAIEFDDTVPVGGKSRLAAAMLEHDELWQRALAFVEFYLAEKQQVEFEPTGRPVYRVAEDPEWKEFSLIITVFKRIQDGRKQALTLANGDADPADEDSAILVDLNQALAHVRNMGNNETNEV